VSVNNGDWVNLSYISDWRFVNTSQSLALYDLDSGGVFDPDDQLGTMVVWTSHGDGSARVAEFREHGAHYRLHYRLHYEGCRVTVPNKTPCPPRL
jgi:hypothetical protein